MTKSPVFETYEISTLNDDEMKRVMSVIERDFKLREKEHKRIENLKNIIKQEQERIECLALSKEFNDERCIRCFKPFKFFFNPKESCSLCKLNVCQSCATRNKENKLWSCKMCLQLKELESLTASWFYEESSKKYKRCGSAKVVRELHKRDKDRTDSDLPDDDDDDDGRRVSPIDIPKPYVVHDETIEGELNEYSKRLSTRIDSLKEDLSKLSTDKSCVAKHSTIKENVKNYLQQLTSEISRTRFALMGSLRRSNIKLTATNENDLRNLIIQTTEEALRINLREFKRHSAEQNPPVSSDNFDAELAQTLYDQYVNKETLLETSELPAPASTASETAAEPQRQSTLPFLADPASPEPDQTFAEVKSRSNTLEKMHLMKAYVGDKGDRDSTPMRSTHESESSEFEGDESYSNAISERADDWKTDFNLNESELHSSDGEEKEETITWL